MTRGVRWAWRLVFGLFAVALSVLALVGAWSVVVFSLAWGVGFGLVAYGVRGRFAEAMQAAGLGGYAGFALTVILVSVVEEVLCAAFGCTLANPVLWIDLVVVVSLWFVWLSTWYLFVAPRFRFDYEEALLCTAATGVLFEILSKPWAVANPLQAVIAAGPVIVVYAAICALPLSLVRWSGTRKGPLRLPVAIFAPFLACLPPLLALFVALTALGVPL